MINIPPLTKEERSKKRSTHNKVEKKIPIVPVPDDAGPCTFMIPDLGKPKLYPYVDKEGKLYGYEARFDYTNDKGGKEKSIFPVCYCQLEDGSKAWRSVGIPKPWPLYQLDEIAGNPNATIVICEGSKSAEAAQELLSNDYVCTTPMHGAYSPQHSDWSITKNRKVLIWPDNDTAGAEFADTAKQLVIAAGAKEVRILKNPDGVKEGWDSADALAENWTKERVKAFLKQEPAKILKAVTLENLLAMQLPPREWIVHPVIQKQGLVMLYAKRGFGKTHLALEIAYAASTGYSLFGGIWKVEKPHKVLLIDGEMTAHSIQKRLTSIAKSYGNTIPPDNLIIITPDFQERGIPDLASREGQEAIAEHLDGVDLVIVDNISCLCRMGKENEGESWLPVQEWALRLRSKGTSVFFVHHAGKSGGQRGTSRREDVLDTVITMKRPDDYRASEGARFIIEFEKSREVCGDDIEEFEAWLKIDGDTARWVTTKIFNESEKQTLELHSQGKSYREIAEQLKIGKTKVGDIIKAAKEDGKLKE